MKLFLRPFFVIALAAGVMLGSCADDKDLIDPNTPIETPIAIGDYPTGLVESSISDIVYTIKEINSGVETTQNFTQMPQTLSLSPGLYNISVTATALQDPTKTDGQTSVSIVAVAQNVTVERDAALTLTLNFFLYTPSTSDFVIEEVFFTGTVTAEGDSYSGDKYFKITNNSDQVLYADRLAVSETTFLTNMQENYYTLDTSNEKIADIADVMKNSTFVNALYMIPGNGTDVPVEPGESIIIADIAINHKVEGHPDAIDLSGAQYEWYDEKGAAYDVDNPDVPNLINYYSASATIWSLHNRGSRGFVLSRIPEDVTPEIFTTRTPVLDENGDPVLDRMGDPLFANTPYYYNYAYMFSYTYPDGSLLERLMTFTSYAIPNEWVVDGVNSAVKDNFQWLVMDPSIDMGWTTASDSNSDATRYSKSVRRKSTLNSWGEPIYQDTNNSSVDFDHKTTPSLL